MENNNEIQKFQCIRSSLYPYCKRVALVGDLRRQCFDDERIEILVISREVDVSFLFGELVGTYPMIDDWIMISEAWLLINKPDHKRFLWEGMRVDVYLTNEYQWGLQMALHTGCDQYAEWLLTNRKHGGALPDGMCVKDGWLLDQGKKIPTLTEQHFYDAIETEWIRPQQRSKGIWER